MGSEKSWEGGDKTLKGGWDGYQNLVILGLLNESSLSLR
jgi:hypothetical protein